MKILPKICSGEMVVSASIPEPGVGAAMTELKTRAKPTDTYLANTGDLCIECLARDHELDVGTERNRARRSHQRSLLRNVDQPHVVGTDLRTVQHDQRTRYVRDVAELRAPILFFLPVHSPGSLPGWRFAPSPGRKTSSFVSSARCLSGSLGRMAVTRPARGIAPVNHDSGKSYVLGQRGR